MGVQAELTEVQEERI